MELLTRPGDIFGSMTPRPSIAWVRVEPLMSIIPLPRFVEDADPSTRDTMTDQERYEALTPPSTIVVRYGLMRCVAEYPYNGDATPGCGSKLIARTFRGTEVVEMLTSTCANSGCSKSVSRKEMLDRIENSGGRDYPFRRDGSILRVATIDDLNRWSAIQDSARERLATARSHARDAGLTSIKIIELEPVLSEELLTVYYLAEERIDFRGLVKLLAAEFSCRIEMKQVGARDEARITADYERCGQHCCCKNFLKVLKPVSMRSAKIQKATLDPLKISGRCGRLMCCLRYEDETYTALKKNLPARKSRVGTPMGPGIVLDTKVLVQLALVQLESDGTSVAIPIEELCDPMECPEPEVVDDPLRGIAPTTTRETPDSEQAQKKHRRRGQREGKGAPSEQTNPTPSTPTPDGEAPKKKKKRRRRRRRRSDGGESGGSGETPQA